MRAVLVAVLLAVLVSACGGERESAPPAEGETTDPASGDPELAEAAETARADLAEDLGVAADDVTIVAVERVTWPNGALGCEEEGMSYTQALVEGYRVELQHAGDTYHYHGAEGRPPSHCPEPTSGGSDG